MDAGTLAQATAAICGGPGAAQGGGRLSFLATSWYCQDDRLARPLITSLLPSLLLTTWQSLIMPIVLYMCALSLACLLPDRCRSPHCVLHLSIVQPLFLHKRAEYMYMCRPQHDLPPMLQETYADVPSLYGDADLRRWRGSMLHSAALIAGSLACSSHGSALPLPFWSIRGALIV